MTKLPKVTLSLLTIVAVAALAPGFASARKGSVAATLPTTTISMGGTTNDGYYFPSTVTKQLGKAQFVFSLEPESGQHNVYLEPKLSTKSLSFTNMRSPVEISSGQTYFWPRTSTGAAAPWKPSKKGTYFLYCTKHPGFNSWHHIGGMTMTVTIT